MHETMITLHRLSMRSSQSVPHASRSAVFPFRGVNGLGTFGSPAVIGSGWNITDMIT